MKSFDRKSLDEQIRLVSRYVAGDLSRSERAEFEAWLIAAPELAAEVEMERRLRRGMVSAAKRGWLRRDSGGASLRGRRWQIAAAASVVVAVTLGVSLTLRHTVHDPLLGDLQDLNPAQAIRTVRLGTVRGLNATPDFTLTAGDMPPQLVIETDVVVLTCEDGTLALDCPGGAAPRTPQYPQYQIEIINRREPASAWHSRPQAPMDRSKLTFTVRQSEDLEAGDYDVLVRGRAADHEEVVARFWLQIAPAK